MQANLAVSEPPLLGKPVQLTVTLTILEQRLIEKADDTSVEIILPEGFELVSGELKGTTNVSKSSSTQFQAVVKSVKVGDWKIRARAIYYSPGNVDNIGSASATLYISVTETSAEVSDRIPISPRKWYIPGKPGETMEPTLPPIKEPVPGKIPSKPTSSSQLGGEKLTCKSVVQTS